MKDVSPGNTLRVVVLSASDAATDKLIAEAIADALLLNNSEGGPGSSVIAAPPSLADDLLLEADAAVVMDALSLRQALEAGVGLCAAVLPTFDTAWAGSLSDGDCVCVVHADLVADAVSRGAISSRVHVVGPIAPKRFTPLPSSLRSPKKIELGLDPTKAVVLIPSSGLDAMDLGVALTQLAQVSSTVQFLFDVDDDVQAAEALRREVPGRDITARMFADRGQAPEYWQLADIVVTRPRSTDVLKALAVGAGLVLPTPGRSDARAADILCRAGLAIAVGPKVSMANAVDQAIHPDSLKAIQSAVTSLDVASGARRLAEHVRRQWGSVEAESRASQRPRGLPKGLETL